MEPSLLEKRVAGLDADADRRANRRAVDLGR
jgi:hypothetical protein